MNTEEVLVSLSEKVMECKTQAEAFGVVLQAYHKGYYDATQRACTQIIELKEEGEEKANGE